MIKGADLVELTDEDLEADLGKSTTFSLLLSQFSVNAAPCLYKLQSSTSYALTEICFFFAGIERAADRSMLYGMVLKLKKDC